MRTQFASRTEILDEVFPQPRAAAVDDHSHHGSERRRKPRRAADRRRATVAALAQWLADRQAQPFFVLDERLTLLLANKAGLQLLRMSRLATIELGQLKFGKLALRRAVIEVTGGEVDEVSLPVLAGADRFRVRISRVALANRPANFILVCVSGEDFGGPSQESLRQHFSLTRAEAEIALAIYGGESLVSIARNRRASINTVKTQVRQIFHKCGVRSKVGLVRKVNLPLG